MHQKQANKAGKLNQTKKSITAATAKLWLVLNLHDVWSTIMPMQYYPKSSLSQKCSGLTRNRENRVK